MEIYFVRRKNFNIFSLAIRYGEAFHRGRHTGCWHIRDYSHVAVSIDNGHVYEAADNKVQRVSEKDFRDRYHVAEVHSFKVDGKKKALLRLWLEGQLGKDYAWCQILKIAGKLLYDKKPKDYVEDNYICTELGLRALVITGHLKNKKGLDYYSVSECRDLVHVLATSAKI